MQEMAWMETEQELRRHPGRASPHWCMDALTVHPPPLPSPCETSGRSARQYGCCCLCCSPGLIKSIRRPCWTRHNSERSTLSLSAHRRTSAAVSLVLSGLLSQTRSQAVRSSHTFFRRRIWPHLRVKITASRFSKASLHIWGIKLQSHYGHRSNTRVTFDL